MNETNTNMLTKERFKALLEAYGADIARWPGAERLAAHAYAETAAEAGALLAEARRIDALLAAVPAPQPSPALEAAILAQIRDAKQARKAGPGVALTGLLQTLWPRAAVWKPASVFASALVLGALIGVDLFGTLSVSDAGSNHEDVLAYAVPSLAQDLN